MLPLVVDDVSKHFKKKQVLRNVSLEVKPGEIFGLIGLNGAGKTTLIKIILGLLKQASGQASIFGQDVKHTQTRQHISFLPEKFQPSHFLKGKEFLSIALSYYKKSFDLDKAKAKAASLDLDPDALDNKMIKYSKGMGQKVGLLSAFMTEAPLVILDEPMSGLDPSARIQLKDNLLEYVKGGNSVFFSSHILADIEEICDRIAVLHNNEMIFVGTPKDFQEKYDEVHLERAFLKAIKKL